MPRTAIRVALIAIVGLTVSTSVVVALDCAAERLFGEWYRGAGEGDDLTLILHRDCTYDAAWTGSRGVYATARGSWRVRDSQVIFTLKSLTGHPPRTMLVALQIVPTTDDLVLIAPGDVERFISGKDPRRWCFTRS